MITWSPFTGYWTFCLTVLNIPSLPTSQNHFLAAVNNFLEELNRKKTDPEIINSITANAILYNIKCRKQKCDRILKKVKSYLKVNKLLAVPFDRGVGFCLMEKNEYYEKVNDIPAGLQFEAVNLRDAWTPKSFFGWRGAHQSGFEETVFRWASVRRVLEIAKVHKTDIPVRPILSMPGSCQDNLANKMATFI